MALAASRWRLLELKRTREAVRGGIDLLDRKRQALLRELLSQRSGALERRTELAGRLAKGRTILQSAFEEIGRPACAAAAVAQVSPVALSVRDDSVLGVKLPKVRAALEPFRIAYGPGGTCAALDEAARTFAALIPLLVEVASLETAVRNLERALKRTTRTLNALKDVLLPSLDQDIRKVAATLDEEERDERSRWMRRSGKG